MLRPNRRKGQKGKRSKNHRGTIAERKARKNLIKKHLKGFCICNGKQYLYADYLDGQIKCLSCQKLVKNPKVENIAPIPNITYEL